MIIGNIELAIEKIKQYDSIVIFHHIRPDGDCLGSQFGLREVIRDTFPNKKVYAVGNDKGMYKFLDFEHDQIPSEQIIKNSLAIIPDANYKERIEFSHLLTKDSFKETLRIDHHPNEDDLDNATRWVDDDYIAAAQMCAELCLLANWNISIKAASAFYLGIYTDSGRFQFDKTNWKTFKTVSELVKIGAQKDLINRTLATSTMKDIKYNAFLTSSMKSKDGVAYVTITQDDLKKYGMSQLNGMRANAIGNIEGLPVWVSFLEEANGGIRVEFRSSGPIIRNVAIKWGGGGHACASGAIIHNMDDAIHVVDDCIAEIKRFKKEGK